MAATTIAALMSIELRNRSGHHASYAEDVAAGRNHSIGRLCEPKRRDVRATRRREVVARVAPRPHTAKLSAEPGHIARLSHAAGLAFDNQVSGRGDASGRHARH